MSKRKVSEMISSKLPLSQDTICNKHTEQSPPKKRKNAHEQLVDEVNALSVDEFRARHINGAFLICPPNESGSAKDFTIFIKTSSDLTKEELNSCFQLIESTSRPDYEASSSFGWHPKRKKREMKEDEMRYLLVWSAQSKDAGAEYGRSSEVLGFLSFMFTHDSVPAVPIMYIYEVHLSPALRKLGLGTHLMHTAENIAASVGVSKVMLTCFLSNDKAHSFYENRGYATDVCSPEDRTTRNKVIKADYVILSKSIPSILTNANPEEVHNDVRASSPQMRSNTEADDNPGDHKDFTASVQNGSIALKTGASAFYSATNDTWHALPRQDAVTAK